MKRKRLQIGFGLLLVLLFLLKSVGIVPFPFLDRLEILSYDLRLTATMPRTQDPRVAIVDIDEKSLAEEGRWPWGRDKLARLVDMLFDRYKVNVVGFDVVFAERDESSGIKVLERLSEREFRSNTAFRDELPRLRVDLDTDRLFAEKIKGRPVVLGFYFTGFDEKDKIRTTGSLPVPVFTTSVFANHIAPPFVTSTGYGANLDQLQQNAHSAGHINPFPDEDGVCRRVAVVIEHQGKFYESLAVAVVRTLLGDPPLVPGFPEKGSEYGMPEWIGLSDLKIPIDKNLTALVPFRGPQGSFLYVSATDVLNGRVKPADLEGAIVLVGTTAPGLMDMRSTPPQGVFPGVEIQANLVAGILDQNIKEKPAYILAAELVILLLAGLILSILLPHLSPLRSLLLTFGLLFVVVVGNIAFWQENVVLPLASPVLMVATLYIFNASWGFFIEARGKRQITGLFGQYVPSALVAEMSKNPKNFTMEGESREMTVLFNDVVNFTVHAESLDAKQLAAMMNEYLSAMTRIIQKHRGTIDKYIGDAIMAFWGAPLHDEEHRRNAVLAALEMQAAVRRLWPRFAEKGWPELHVGIGINTGVMSVGNMGSEFRMAYTVMGDAVNLAARLEGLTRQYRLGIIVGEETRSYLPEIAFREIDQVRVKGRAEPVDIYEPLGSIEELAKETLAELDIFEEMLRAYRAREWQKAHEIVGRLLERAPEVDLYHVYRERTAYYLVNPPGGEWDGVFKFSTK